MSYLNSKNFLFLFAISSIPFVLAGFLARTEGLLIQRSLWLDEALLAHNVINRSYIELLLGQNSAMGQSAPILFYLGTKSLIDIIHLNENILRIIPFISGIAILPAGFYIAQKFFTRIHGFIFITLLSLSPLLIKYTNEFKQYSSDALIALILIGFSLNVINSKYSNKSLVFWLIVCSFSLWSSHSAIIIVAAIGSVFGIVALANKDVKLVVRLLIVAAILALNLIFVYLSNIKPSTTNDTLVQFHTDYYWPIIPTSTNDILFYKNTVYTFFLNSMHPALIIPGILLFSGGAISLFYNSKEHFTTLISPLLLLLLLSSLKFYPLQDRLLLFAYPFVFLFITIALYQIYKNSAIPVFLFVILSLFYPLLISSLKLIKEPKDFESIRPVLSSYVSTDLYTPIYIWRSTASVVSYYEKQFNIEIPNKKTLQIEPYEYHQIENIIDPIFSSDIKLPFYLITSNAFDKSGDAIDEIKDYLSKNFSIDSKIDNNGVSLIKYTDYKEN